MKKYLLLILSIFSIFFITDNVSALTFEDGTTVDDTNFIYYVYAYHSEDFENYQYFSTFKNVTGPYRAIVFFNDSKKPYFPNNPGNLQLYTGLRVCSFYLDKDNYSCKDLTEDSMRTSYTLLFTNYSYNSSIQANITKDDLSNFETTIPTYKITYYINNELYQEFEVEKGSSHDLLIYDFNEFTHIFSGWQYDENINFTNITSDITINATLEEKDIIPVYIEFPITKNEFYALLVEVGLLIMIIFLKWCFPFKGGSDLK